MLVRLVPLRLVHCQLACSSVLQIQSLHWRNTILIHGPVYQQTVVLQCCPASSYTASCSCDHGCALLKPAARQLVHVNVVAGVKNSPALAQKGCRSLILCFDRACLLVCACRAFARLVPAVRLVRNVLVQYSQQHKETLSRRPSVRCRQARPAAISRKIGSVFCCTECSENSASQSLHRHRLYGSVTVQFIRRSPAQVRVVH